MRHRLVTAAIQSMPSALLEEWVDAGLIAPEQAEAIRAHEAARSGAWRGLSAAPAPHPSTMPSLVVEALGYLGGGIMLVGAGILASLYWEDIAVALRLSLVATVVLSLVGAGLAVPDQLGGAPGRLCAVLCALGVAATGVFFSVLSTDVLHRYDEDALIIIGPATAVAAGVLWLRRRTWLQQAALLAPLVLTAAAVGLEASDTDAAPGMAVWILALAWTALAWTGRLAPRQMGVALGGVTGIFGASTIGSEHVSILLGLATAVALLALALYGRSLSWLAVAAFGFLLAGPRAVVEWFPGMLSASLTLLVTGGLLAGSAVWVTRHQQGNM